MKIGFSLTGAKELVGLLRDLPQAVQARVISVALGDVGKKIRDDAKALAPVRSGALKKSIIYKVRKGKQGKIYAVVGPDRDYYISGRKKKKNESLTAARLRGESIDKPNKYAHLVEYGTAHSAAKPFLRPAVNNGGPVASKIFAAGLNKGQKKEIERLRKRAAKKGILL